MIENNSNVRSQAKKKIKITHFMYPDHNNNRLDLLDWLLPLHKFGFFPYIANNDNLSAPMYMY